MSSEILNFQGAKPISGMGSLSNIKKISDLELKNVNQTECIIQKLENVDFVILRNTLKKFLEDKLFFQDEDHIIITEGILLNKKDLLTQTSHIDFAYAP
ncbi:hypothetical protein ACI3DN_09180 [Sellimonas catena]|uniref:hypothetical protein n=1 Tax=Sellimonas catena TaxID=2994035 RepID=UPI00386A9735